MTPFFNTKAYVSLAPDIWMKILVQTYTLLCFFFYSPQTIIHKETASWLRQTEGLGPVVVLVPGAPAGLFVVCLPGWWWWWGGLPTALSLAPACPEGEKPASVPRRMLPLWGCGRTDMWEEYIRGVYEMGQLVSLHVQWLKHRHHNPQTDTSLTYTMTS